VNGRLGRGSSEVADLSRFANQPVAEIGQCGEPPPKRLFLKDLCNRPIALLELSPCPTHWDRFNVTYDVAQDAAVERLQTFIAEVKAASPDTKVVVPKYFEPVAIP
jgi:hypothetical protein